MRIVLFTYDFPPFVGGISAYTRNLASGLREEGHEIRVVCPGSAWTPGVPGLSVHRFNADGSDLHRVWKGFVALRKLTESVRPDVVHATSSLAHLSLGSINTAGARIMTVHGTELNRNLRPNGLNGFRRKIFLPSYLKADRIICVSHFTRSLAQSRGLPPEKLDVVHNGIDTQPRYHAPEELSHLRARFGLYGKKVLLTIAHLHPRKGQMEVIQALPEVRRSVPNVAYVMVGSGDYRDDLRLEAHALGLDSAVRFCGEAAESSHFYAIADALVQFSLPAGSSLEGFGLSVAEAMAEGVPVIVSDTGGLPEVGEHDRSGWVIPHDQPAGLPAAIIKALTETKRANQVGEAGRARVRQMFSIPTFARNTLAVYGKALHP